MARPIVIDRDQARRAARSLFWRQGYRKTSLQELLRVLGMGAGSFYAAFGSKSDLYAAVMHDYCRDSLTLIRRCREAHSGVAALRAFLDRSLVDVSDEARHRGCLLISGALELADGSEPELRDVTFAHLREFRVQIHSCMADAHRSGELRAGLSPADATDLLMTLMIGLRGASRLGLSSGSARRQVELTMALLAKA